MKEEELLSVLADFNDVYLFCPAGEVEIEPQISVIMRKDGSDYDTIIKEYAVTVGGKTKKVKPKKFLKKLEKIAFYENGEFKLAGIGADRKSYEKYLAEVEFSKIDMSGLLETYGDIANLFSLTCPYNGYDENGRIYYKISDELADVAEKEIKLWAKNESKEQLKGCNNLPPFDELYAEIEEEYAEYYSKNIDFAREHDGSVFMCDRFSDGKTRYSEPDELWYAYGNVEFAANCTRELQKMKASVTQKPLCAELDGDDALKFNLKDIKVGFTWHCTTSGEISKTFFFELNETTKKWLIRHKDDYDFDILQDLAFYKDEKILFSSCTHEGFHTDLREVKNG